MLYFLITKNDSVNNINAQKCECSFVLNNFFQKLTECKIICPNKMKTPGPSHQVDELKAPGSLWSKNLKQFNTVLIQAVWPQGRQFFRLLGV